LTSFVFFFFFFFFFSLKEEEMFLVFFIALFGAVSTNSVVLTNVSQLVNSTVFNFTIATTLAIDTRSSWQLGHQRGTGNETTHVLCQATANPCIQFTTGGTGITIDSNILFRNFNFSIDPAADNNSTPMAPYNVFSFASTSTVASLSFSDVRVASAPRSRFLQIVRSSLNSLEFVDVVLDSIGRFVFYGALGAVRTLRITRTQVKAAEDLVGQSAPLSNRIATIFSSRFELTQKFDVFNTVTNDSSRYAQVLIDSVHVTGGEFLLDSITNLNITNCNIAGTSFRIRNCGIAAVINSTYDANDVTGSVFRVDSTSFGTFGINNFTAFNTDSSKAFSDFVVVAQNASMDAIVLANIEIDTFTSMLFLDTNSTVNAIAIVNITVHNRTQLLQSGSNVRIANTGIYGVHLLGTYDRPAVALSNPVNVFIHKIDAESVRFAGAVFSFSGQSISNVSIVNSAFRNGSFESIVRLGDISDSSSRLFLNDLAVLSSTVGRLVITGGVPLYIDGIVMYDTKVKDSFIDATSATIANISRVAVVNSNFSSHLLVAHPDDIDIVKTMLVAGCVFNDTVIALHEGDSTGETLLLIDGLAIYNTTASHWNASLVSLWGTSGYVALRNIDFNLTSCEQAALVSSFNGDVEIESLSATRHYGSVVIDVRFFKSGTLSNITISDSTRVALVLGEFDSVDVSDVVVRGVVSDPAPPQCKDFDRGPVIIYGARFAQVTRAEMSGNVANCEKIAGTDDAASALWVIGVETISLIDVRVISNRGTSAAIWIAGCKIATVRDCWFEGNVAARGGGGALAYGLHEFFNSTVVTATVTNCVFLANMAPRGAAIATAGGRINIDRSRFLDNNATGGASDNSVGGAVISLQSEVRLTDVRFAGNVGNNTTTAAMMFWDSNVTLTAVDVVGSRIMNAENNSFATGILAGSDQSRRAHTQLSRVSFTGGAGGEAVAVALWKSGALSDACFCNNSAIDLACGAEPVTGNATAIAGNCANLMLSRCGMTGCPLRAPALVTRPAQPSTVNPRSPVILLTSLPKVAPELLFPSSTTRMVGGTTTTSTAFVTGTMSSSTTLTPGLSSTLSDSTGTSMAIGSTTVAVVSDSTTEAPARGEPPGTLDIALIAGAAGGGGAALLLVLTGVIMCCVLKRRDKSGGHAGETPEMVSASSMRSEGNDYMRIPTSLGVTGADNYDVGNINTTSVLSDSAASASAASGGGSTEMRTMSGNSTGTM
jgi:hypothetical protein